jgi:hypothetical protein
LEVLLSRISGFAAPIHLICFGWLGSVVALDNTIPRRKSSRLRDFGFWILDFGLEKGYRDFLK